MSDCGAVPVAYLGMQYSGYVSARSWPGVIMRRVPTDVWAQGCRGVLPMFAIPRFCRRRLALAGFVVLLAGAFAAFRANAPHRAPRVYNPRSEVFGGWVDIGVPVLDARIARIGILGVMPRMTVLRLVTKDGVALIERPDQLVGYVRITDPDCAHRWARNIDGWRNAHEVRIDDTPAWRPVSEYERRSGDRRTRTYSTKGELTLSDFRAGGFTVPVVRPESRGYVLDRWVFLPTFSGDPGGVEHLRETIQADGAYTRTVLKRRQAPRLPAGEWGRLFGLM